MYTSLTVQTKCQHRRDKRYIFALVFFCFSCIYNQISMHIILFSQCKHINVLCHVNLKHPPIAATVWHAAACYCCCWGWSGRVTVTQLPYRRCCSLCMQAIGNTTTARAAMLRVAGRMVDSLYLAAMAWNVVLKVQFSTQWALSSLNRAHVLHTVRHGPACKISLPFVALLYIINRYKYGQWSCFWINFGYSAIIGHPLSQILGSRHQDTSGLPLMIIIITEVTQQWVTNTIHTECCPFHWSDVVSNSCPVFKTFSTFLQIYFTNSNNTV